jgi:hypothetical protein
MSEKVEVIKAPLKSIPTEFLESEGSDDKLQRTRTQIENDYEKEMRDKLYKQNDFKKQNLFIDENGRFYYYPNQFKDEINKYLSKPKINPDISYANKDIHYHIL